MVTNAAKEQSPLASPPKSPSDQLSFLLPQPTIDGLTGTGYQAKLLNAEDILNEEDSMDSEEEEEEEEEKKKREMIVSMYIVMTQSMEMVMPMMTSRKFVAIIQFQ